jgi:hypothetical protein
MAGCSMPSRLRVWEMTEIRAETDQPLGTGRGMLEAARCRLQSIIKIIRITINSPGRTVDGATLVDGLRLASRVVN